MRDSFYVWLYSVKYWLQGDTWKDAKEFATVIVRGFKKP